MLSRKNWVWLSWNLFPNTNLPSLFAPVHLGVSLGFSAFTRLLCNFRMSNVLKLVFIGATYRALPNCFSLKSCGHCVDLCSPWQLVLPHSKRKMLVSQTFCLGAFYCDNRGINYRSWERAPRACESPRNSIVPCKWARMILPALRSEMRDNLHAFFIYLVICLIILVPLYRGVVGEGTEDKRALRNLTYANNICRNKHIWYIFWKNVWQQHL